MYVNFVNDRKSLGYECLIDTQCGDRLVLITDSIVVFVKNVSSNGKRKIFVIILGMILIFSEVQSAEAIGLSMPPRPPSEIVRVHKPSYDYRSEIKIAKTVSPKLDKITFIKYRI